MFEIPTQKTVYPVYHSDSNMIGVFRVAFRNCTMTDILARYPFNVIQSRQP
ncbi:hypothetical protein M1N58_02775 [Dehalococcoidales bacterium]|nr:hypothetical protein [Dehalococcoidales bacterium]